MVFSASGKHVAAFLDSDWAQFTPSSRGIGIVVLQGKGFDVRAVFKCLSKWSAMSVAPPVHIRESPVFHISGRKKTSPPSPHDRVLSG